MALSVGALWTCLGLETAACRQVDRNVANSLQTLARLRHLTGEHNAVTPAREPLPFSHARRWSAS